MIVVPKLFSHGSVMLLGKLRPRIAIVLMLIGQIHLLGGCASPSLSNPATQSPNVEAWQARPLQSLDLLSIDSLASRSYAAKFEVLEKLDDGSWMLGYRSDGNNIFARLLLPQQPTSASGFPIIVYSHGWVGLEGASKFDFYTGKGGAEKELIDGYRNDGFAVLILGFRGHGVVAGRAAEGRADIQIWDNSSYLSPMFYAIDILNAVSAIASLNSLLEQHPSNKLINGAAVFVSGHSQGGDSALVALAVASGRTDLKVNVIGGSIWAGCFLPRVSQVELYGPMAETPQAFLAGDGRWRASPKAPDGSVNADFRFGYPAEWIDEPDPAHWTWQKQSWKTPDVLTVLRSRYSTMDKVIAENIRSGSFSPTVVARDSTGRSVAGVDPSLLASLKKIGAYHVPEKLVLPLNLHFSDRDYYSPPNWNIQLASDINRLGGKATAYQYDGNTHSLGVSKREWFSPPGTLRGLPIMLARDVALFRSLVNSAASKND